MNNMEELLCLNIIDKCMIFACLLLATLITAEKKIELQDIEEDNLRSEKQKYYEKSEARSQGQSSGSERGPAPFDYLKNGILQYFESATQQPQQQRYVQQYAVTEQPERPPEVTPKPQYGPPAAQQAMVGYLSNIPMQVYLVPQYYNEADGPAAHSHSGLQITAPATARVANYQTQTAQQQANYMEVPTYVTPTGKPYGQSYNSPVIYVSHAQPTLAPVQATATPVLTYQVPVTQYQTAIAAPPTKGYYQTPQFTEPDTVDEVQENEIHVPKYTSSHAEIPPTKPPGSHYPRYYNSRAPVREEYRTPQSELPLPSELLIKAPPPHLSHIPKALPVYRPLTKPVYSAGGGFLSSSFTPKPSESYSIPFRRRPSSLLDSYIPSSVQIEYMKRGYTKDPLAAFEALSSARHLSQVPVIPRHYENGFLPNQMYHTAAGGITYGHHKRASTRN